MRATRVTIQWSFEPTLRFFQSMDAIGLALTSEFKDWQRLPNRLQVEDKSRHRRVSIQATEFIYEHDDPGSADGVLRDSTWVHEQISSCFGLEKYKQLVVTYLFVFEVSGEFAFVVDKLRKRCFSPDPRLVNAVGSTARVVDLAFIHEYRFDDSRKMMVSLAAMRRDEYFEKVKHEPRLYPGVSLNEYKSTFPDPLLYLSLSYLFEDAGQSRFADDVRQSAADAASAARGFFQLYQEPPSNGGL